MVALQGQYNDDAVRDRMGATATTLVVKHPDPLVGLLDEVLKDYHLAVKAQGKGHQLGPPGIYLIFKLVENLLARPGVSLKTDMLFWTQGDAMAGPLAASSMLGICRWTKMRNPMHRKLVLSLKDDIQAEMIAALVEEGAERKSGPAPRGPVSRRIQDILDGR